MNANIGDLRKFNEKGNSLRTSYLAGTKCCQFNRRKTLQILLEPNAVNSTEGKHFKLDPHWSSNLIFFFKTFASFPLYNS